MQEYKVEGHESSLLPDGKKFKLIWNDEFDGPELDTTKWDFRKNFWGKEFETFAGKEAIKFKDSTIELHVIKDKDMYKAPLLQTGSLTYDLPKDSGGFWPFGRYEKPKFSHTFGYYECRCKLQKQQGWWSAFWIQAPGIGSSPFPEECGVEIDIMESFEPGKVIPHTVHWGGYGKNHGGANTARGLITSYTPFEPEDVLNISTDEFHTFGVLWEKDGYTFYVDGKQSGDKITSEIAPISHAQSFILIHGECQGYRSGNPDPALEKMVLPECFTVDYVRVFDFEEETDETVLNKGKEYGTTDFSSDPSNANH